MKCVIGNLLGWDVIFFCKGKHSFEIYFEIKILKMYIFQSYCATLLYFLKEG